MIEPIIAGHESIYKSVAAATLDVSTGVVVPNGETWAVYRFTANGADPNAYDYLVWDKDGGGEKIFSSTKGDIDRMFDSSLSDNQITGDGSKKLQIVIDNNNIIATPVVGGSFEAVKVG